MKTKGKKLFFVSVIIIVVILMISSPFLISYFYLPTQVRIFAGEEHLFNFEMPFEASFKSDVKKLHLEDVNHKPIQDEKVNLSKPFYMTINDEGNLDVKLSLGFIPLKTVAVEAVPYEKLIPCGEIVGIHVSTDGILVLGVGDFEVNGRNISPAKGIIEPGDVILSCNNEVLNEKEDLKVAIEQSKGKIINLEIKRNKEIKQVDLVPVYSPIDDSYKVGLWIRDSIQGIGTITYVTPESRNFGALGHGITDSETKKLMPIREGNVVNASITQIKKGTKGQPGEISGIIDYEKEVYGEVIENTSLGIFGTLNKKFSDSLTFSPMPIALQDKVHEGKASILADLTQDGPTLYEVEIQKVSKYSNAPSKGMVIKITDEKLLSLTSGIVQGMSGSPIIQDGQLVGAVTHVFIQDPTRGYGIFIENMINNDKR
ncbi:SpoIVB peptidase [Cellulosilyticum ruminicola]|uniref:SpoIVB peptidase n=1 Tax=Cellulosilyticum ruminicola TaxID=425254 RepID=UPI0006D2B333|nr:SpoIVB peptidase [Cellulosilyticum ruminicola]